ncbi:hypothetical protein AAMO2058_001201700 [Amorphochlora amoebiformis]
MLTSEIVQKVQIRTGYIRNICVLAHIDHGKTTLSDYLVSSNGIISNRLAGKIRYLDSRDDEQQRGITMKSSSIALLYKHDHKTALKAPKTTDLKDQNSNSNANSNSNLNSNLNSYSNIKSETKKGPKRKKGEGKRKGAKRGKKSSKAKESLGQVGKRGEGGVYMVNLIDSPGHIDFCSEVSTAVRFSDGGVVLVDVVEGVCTQTRTVLQQAWAERLKCVLVLNKIDKLFTELKNSPREAYDHLNRVIEQVNAVTSSFANAEAAERAAESNRDNVEFDEKHAMVFSPEMGNIAFASAHDTWGFTILDLAEYYAKILPVKRKVLSKTLWGTYYYNTEKKGPMRRPSSQNPTDVMAVEYILKPIWEVYSLEHLKFKDRLSEIIQELQIKVPPREIVGKTWREKTRAVLGRWLPIAKAILGLAVDQLPDPKTSQGLKIARIWKSSDRVSGQGYKSLRRAALDCDKNSEQLLIYVAKMLDVGNKSILQAVNAVKLGGLKRTRQFQRSEYVRGKVSQPQVMPKSTEPSQEIKSNEIEESQPQLETAEIGRFLAFARVFAGTIRTDRDQDLYILKSGYDPKASEEENKRYVLKIKSSKLRLFVLMGKAFQMVSQVPAGCVLGISGLDTMVVNSATITSDLSVPPLSAMQHSSTPIVKVAVTPHRYPDMTRLLEGLRLLKQADPNVEVATESNGEHIIVTSGELHLERCLLDLRTRFAQGVDFKVSPPLVGFRETILDAFRRKDTSEGSKRTAYVTKSNTSSNFSITVRAIPLPKCISDALTEQKRELDTLFRSAKTSGGHAERTKAAEGMICARELIRKAILHQEKEKKEHGNAQTGFGFWKRLDLSRIIALGPDRTGANVLVDVRKKGTEESISHVSNAISTAFQMVMEKGPLCEEPMMGVALLIEDMKVDRKAGGSGSLLSSGQIIQTTRDAFREAILIREARLIEPMYLVELQCSETVLRRLYAVIGKRRGRIISEDLREGTQTFIVKCYLPVERSFGFASSLRGRTSGMASPQLMFSHWEIIPEDPFFVPVTDEEKEEFGSAAVLKANLARTLVDGVRKRKGLAVQELIVQHAEKQRTLARKK